MLQKLKSILPEDDRCVVITDPLDIVLDRLMQGDSLDADVRYMINRMAALREAEGRRRTNTAVRLAKVIWCFAPHGSS